MSKKRKKKLRKAKTVTIPRFFMGPLRARVVSAGSLLLFLLCLSPLGSASNPHKEKSGQAYALIAGTVWGPDNHPVYGVRVRIRRAKDKPKKVRWDLYSDHNGEFAQRVPPGENDYILSTDRKGLKLTDGTIVFAPEVTVHIYNDEREDTGLHLTRNGAAPSHP